MVHGHQLCVRDGRYASLTCAVCLARVMEQFGASATVLVYEGRARHGIARMCADMRCPCNSGRLIGDHDLRSTMGPWLQGVARAAPGLTNMETDTRRWAETAQRDTSRAQYA